MFTVFCIKFVQKTTYQILENRLSFREDNTKTSCNIFSKNILVSFFPDTVYVCLSVRRRKFIFANPMYLQGIQVRFICEGHRVKVKDTAAKKVENPCPAIFAVSNPGSIKHTAMKFACRMGFLLRRIEWRVRHLCHVTGSEHA